MDFTPYIKKFKTVDLESLDKVKMLNRKDTKFVFNERLLPSILEDLTSSYKILEIDNNLIFNYDNNYFDTKNFLFYNQHHNENRNRYKIRYRNYSSTNSTYFEIKTKNNKDRTIKKRLISDSNQNNFNEKEKKIIESIIKIQPNKLKKSININFSRITFVDNLFSERITIDTNLKVKNENNNKIFNNLIISEIKQNKYNPKSPFIKLFRDIKILEMRFSKYCMGMIEIYPELKQNRFKPKLNRINKIYNQEY